MTDALSIVLTLMLIFVGAGLGATIRYQDVLECLHEKRLAAGIGTLTQFGFMPAIAYMYARSFKLSDENATGLLLIASAPGGVTSNLLTYYANGDVTLSISMSAVTTILSFGVLPALIEIYIKSTFTSDDLDIPYEWIVISLLTLIVPCAIGVFVRSKSELWAKRLEKTGSYIGIIFLILALVWGIVSNEGLFDQVFGVWWSAATLQLIGGALSFGLAYAVGLPSRTQRTISLEAGVQNVTLIITLISNSFEGDQRTNVLIPALIYSVSYFWNSAIMVGIFRLITQMERVPTNSSVNLDQVKVDQSAGKVVVEEAKSEKTIDTVSVLSGRRKSASTASVPIQDLNIEKV